MPHPHRLMIMQPVPLRARNVRIDEAFFPGGIRKSGIPKAFDTDIFFDDRTVRADPASKPVPAARVPTDRIMSIYQISGGFCHVI